MSTTQRLNVQETDWYKSRPTKVQARIDAYPPNRLYRLVYEDTDQIVPLYSYGESESGECDTCTVLVLRQYNPFILFERRVFGVSFDKLEMLSLEEEEQLSKQESA